MANYSKKGHEVTAVTSWWISAGTFMRRRSDENGALLLCEVREISGVQTLSDQTRGTRSTVAVTPSPGQVVSILFFTMKTYPKLFSCESLDQANKC